ncbi:MAG: hypothetical protein V4484_06885 [Pseudomonadota bacterium]
MRTKHASRVAVKKEKPGQPHPVTRHLAADQDMDDATGLSNRVNRPSPESEAGDRQAAQSNVGRRDDGTPD